MTSYINEQCESDDIMGFTRTTGPWDWEQIEAILFKVYITIFIIEKSAQSISLTLEGKTL